MEDSRSCREVEDSRLPSQDKPSSSREVSAIEEAVRRSQFSSCSCCDGRFFGGPGLVTPPLCERSCCWW